MIAGTVTWLREAIVEIAIQGSESDSHSIQCVVDTGFNGDIALPNHVIEQLDLDPSDNLLVILGNGDQVFMQVHNAVVSWHDRLINVEVLETDRESAIGMALLENSTLTVQIWDGGEVLIEERS